MDKHALIGYTGFIGTLIRSAYPFTNFYNRNNIIDIANTGFNTVVCAAPTSNRVLVNQDPIMDLETILFTIDHLRKMQCQRFVLISTVDVVQHPNTKYGLNRRLLEGWVKQHIENYSIIRLPSLIHPKIQKNILYDLKNKLYLDKINPNTSNQWYPVLDLVKDIQQVGVKQEVNLVSEPIFNSEIIERFGTGLNVLENGLPSQQYKLTPYKYTKQEIFQYMEKYFNEVPIHLW